jgi:RNase P subunit RPR2
MRGYPQAWPGFSTRVKILTFGLKVRRAMPDMSPMMDVPKRTKTQDPVETGQRSAEGMHACPSCSSVLVQPVNWHEQGDGRWNVELRCPECEWWGRDTYTQSEVDTYDEELDRGGQELIEDLRSLTRANMEDEADRFAMALSSDCILPEDF